MYLYFMYYYKTLIYKTCEILNDEACEVHDHMK